MAIFFVADLHLSQQRPDLIEAFSHFLDQTARGADAVYMLGDIFEVWIGDDFLDPCFSPIISALQTLNEQGCKIYFQHGNRDFLVGNSFAQHIGAQLLDEKVIVHLPSQKALIMHGDQLCTDDTEYQKFRSLVRSKEWQQNFLAKTIEERLLIAEQLRNVSKAQTGLKSTEITDVNPLAVEQAMRVADVELLIHGHTHRPATHKFLIDQRETMRIVLGDWDKSLWYLECTLSGCLLIEIGL
jgi:UDP-2,3-diacylglucosamine hydrolase